MRRIIHLASRASKENHYTGGDTTENQQPQHSSRCGWYNSDGPSVVNIDIFTPLFQYIQNIHGNWTKGRMSIKYEDPQMKVESMALDI